MVRRRRRGIPPHKVSTISDSATAHKILVADTQSNLRSNIVKEQQSESAGFVPSIGMIAQTPMQISLMTKKLLRCPKKLVKIVKTLM